MHSKSLLWSLFSALYTVSCVYAATTHNQYPLEFITQDYASASAMSYGFQLLEDIRQIRMGCEERRDELERQFTLELQNWMKYSQQTQQLITKAEFGKNTPESKEMVQETLTSTYRELYSSRMRRLNVIERQCDEKLEELLQQRKMSMMLLVAGLMNQNLDRLKDVVGELANYKTQLQNGLQNCIERQTARYESRISSKLLAPEDYCSGPDIDILTAFLNRMLAIIMEEQMNFFGDDEDLELDTPCGSSGCGDIEETTDTTHHAFDTSTVPASNTMATQPNTQSTHSPPSPPSHELPTRPTQPHTHGSTQIPSTDTTRQPPTYDTTQPETTSTTTTGIPTDITAEMKPPSTEQNLPIIATQSTDTTPEMKLPVTEPESVQPEIKVPVTEPAMHTTTPEPYEEQTSTQPETKLPHTTAPVEDTTTLTTPVWLDNVVEDILHPEQAQAQVQSEVPEEQHYDTGEDSEEEKSTHSPYHQHHKGHSTEDEDSRTGSRHSGGHGGSHGVVIDIPQYDTQGDISRQNPQDDSNSGHIYRPIIYSFAGVGGVLAAATLVLVMAIVIV